MTRSSLLSLAALLASCSPAPAPSCPGEPVASFTFSGTKTDAGTLDPALDLDPEPSLTDCAAEMGFPAPSLPVFTGTLSADATGPGGALCRTAGPILYGTRSGVRWEVEDASDGAVLGGCDPTCAAQSRIFIRGDVVPDTTAPTGFVGALVEQLTQTGGACGPCILPCAARYALSGTVEASP